jgi:hypothetical protein
VTPELLHWGKEAVRRFCNTEGYTLEIGSRNVNPSLGTYRQFFTGPYIGVDQEEGFGVDFVSKVVEIPSFAWAEDFDTLVCTEMIEHDLLYWRSINHATVCLKEGGTFVLTTCGFGAAYHPYPNDYYRFTMDAIKGNLEWWGYEVLTCGELLQGNQAPWHSIVAVGRKL